MSLQHLGGLRQMVESLLLDPVPESDQEKLASELADIRYCRKLLGDREKELVAAYAGVAPRSQVIPGIGVVEWKKGSVRKHYDHDGLFAELRERASNPFHRADGMTGEVLMSEVQYFAKLVRDCAAISYWRKGECAGVGIDLDSYCEKEDGPPSVVFPGAGLDVSGALERAKE